jgi:chromosome segregation ATPase
MYALPLSGAIGPIQKAEHDLLASKQTINSQIDSIRNLLLQLINMLQTQQKDADTQKNDLLQKQNTIDTSNKALTSARQEVNQNKLLPKDVKDPLNEMFNSTGSLISQMSNVITNR